MKQRIVGEAAVFLLAVQFLTRIPLPRDIGFTPARLAAAVRYYPLVGAAIGGMAAVIYLLANTVFPVTLSVLLSTAAVILLTGAFHEDGLADTFDGIGGGLTRERSLEIMKDSRVGTYGAAALGLAIAIKVTTLSMLMPEVIVMTLIAGHTLSRLSSVMVIATSRYVRDHGTGKPTADGMNVTSKLLATATGLICLLMLMYCLSPLAAGGAVIGVLVGQFIMRLLFERKLGGYTGDTLGAVQQFSELGCYLGIAACY